METGGGSGGGGGDDVHGLMFGKKIYFEQDAAAAGGSGTAGAGGRRGRGAAAASGGGGAASSAATTGATATPPRCQVEGCGVDLSGAKTYYCRHKVCSMHSKAPRVVVAGIEQRFCQQCSRFHQLPEFDQGKRSCRRRLAGHNERRRKPPPGPLTSRFGRFAASFQEPGRLRSFLLDFSYPAGASSSSGSGEGWPAIPPGGDRMPGTLQWQQGNVELLHPHRGAVAGYGGDHAYIGPGGSVAAAGAPFELPPGGGCVTGVATDSTSCALSLLSTHQPWDHTSSHQHRSPAMSFDGAAPVSPSVVASSYAAASTWSGSSRVHEGGASRSLQHRLPQQQEDDLHMVHPASGSVHHHGHFSGELELALQGSGPPPNPPHHVDSSSFGGHASNAMNWSL